MKMGLCVKVFTLAFWIRLATQICRIFKSNISSPTDSDRFNSGQIGLALRDDPLNFRSRGLSKFRVTKGLSKVRVINQNTRKGRTDSNLGFWPGSLLQRLRKWTEPFGARYFTRPNRIGLNRAYLAQSFK